MTMGDIHENSLGARYKPYGIFQQRRDVQYCIYDKSDPEFLAKQGKHQALYQLYKLSYEQARNELLLCVGEHNALLEPDLYFYVVRNTLRCIGTEIEFHFDKENNITNLGRNFSTFAYRYGWQLKSTFPLIISFLTKLKLYLAMRKPTPYHLAVMQICWEYHLHSSLPILDQPNNYFRQMDGVVYYAHERVHVLTDRLLDSLLAPQNHIYPFSASKCRNKFYKRLYEILAPIEFVPHDPSACHYRGYQLKYLHDSNVFQVLPILTENLPVISITPPPIEAKEVLAQLSGRSPMMVDLLLELFARIASPTLPSSKIWVVMGSREDKESFISFLSMVFPQVVQCDFPTILSKKNILCLYDLALNGAAAIYSRADNSSPQYLQRKQQAMRNFVAGVPIMDICDPICRTDAIHAKSNLAVLYFADDEKSLPPSFMGIPTVKIMLQDVHLLVLTQECIDWLQTMAVYIGLYKIFQKNEDALGVPAKEAVSFGNRFCKAQQGMYCDRIKLLNAFREYYLCLYGTNISTNNNTPAKLTQLISTTLKIPVQRVRKNKNRLAFDGLCFDEKAFKTFISAHTKKISEEEFSSYIDNMSKQIRFLK